MILNILRKCDRRRLIIFAVAVLAALAVVVTGAVFIVREAKEASGKDPRIISLDIDVPDDMPLEEKEKIVYQSLITAGFSPAGACGMMGNIAAESSDFDPTVINESNGAFGLFQWTDVGDRQQKLKDFCRDNSMNYGSIEGQIAFAVYEISGADPIACRLDDLLRETDDPYTAAAEFTAGFERCIADSGSSSDKYTGSLYPEFYGEYYQDLSKRINRAMNYYERFKDADFSNDPTVKISINDGFLSVYAFSAGAADCFLLTTKNSAVMIDCAEKNDGSDIAAYLSDNNITHLDYLIISHYDKDHIGGAKKILEEVDVNHILVPDYEKDSGAYDRFYASAEEEGVMPEKITTDRSFELDGIKYDVNPPAGGYAEDESNNSSLIVSVTNREDTMLFMGDAEDERIREYLEKDDRTYGLLKVPHHGRFCAETAALVERVRPRIAIITASDDEPEDYETVQILEEAGAEVFVTQTGPVMVDSTGSGIIARTVIE